MGNALLYILDTTGTPSLPTRRNKRKSPTVNPQNTYSPEIHHCPGMS
jgi:hypothetical protein